MGRSRPRVSAPAGRDAAAVVGTLLALGLLGGVLWSQVVVPAEFTKLASGGTMGEDQLSRQFAADAWYVVIAVVAGAPAGALLSWWRSRDPLLTSVLLVVGAALAAAAMALVGHLLGPGSTQAALDAAPVGARVPERLDVDTFVAYLGWPVGVLAGALFVLLGKGPEEGAWHRGEPRGSVSQTEPAS
jgi:hypothetical protein